MGKFRCFLPLNTLEQIKLFKAFHNKLINMYQPVPGAERLEVPEDVQEMFEWAAARGVRWPKIVYPVRFPPGYIGSMATEEIHPNERIVIAPNNSLFTSKRAREAPDLKPVFENCPESFSKSMLGLVTFLIWEKFKGSASEWAPFIKYQPKNPSNYQDWSDAELLELQDADAMQDVFFT